MNCSTFRPVWRSATSTRSARGISTRIGRRRGATANTTDWGTDRYTALELIEDALNLKTPTVYDTVDKKPVVNAQSTEAAREKQERIKERFKEWVWSDDSRRERLCRLYNDTFNHTRVRTFNGDHLTLPGASGAIQLHAHQKAGVWRILQTPNTLLAHVVGAGKTYTMVAAAMESRRLGFPASRCLSSPITCSASSPPSC